MLEILMNTTKEAFPSPTPDEVENGLTSVSSWIRRDWAKRMDVTPTPEQIEMGLTDEDGLGQTEWTGLLHLSK